jgi:hypothetical protein
MAEWSECRTQIPAKVQRGICEQDTLNSQFGVAIISIIACGTPNPRVKKKLFVTMVIYAILLKKCGIFL